MMMMRRDSDPKNEERVFELVDTGLRGQTDSVSILVDSSSSSTVMNDPLLFFNIQPLPEPLRIGTASQGWSFEVV